MKYRAILCEDCSEVNEFSMSIEKCPRCQSKNLKYGYQITEKDFKCFRIEMPLQELYSSN